MTLGLGLGYGATTAFVMVATALVIVLAAIYIVMNAACIGYFARPSARGARRFNPLLHLVIPVLGIITFVPAWLTVRGHQGVLVRGPAVPAVLLPGPRGGRLDGRRGDLPCLPVPP